MEINIKIKLNEDISALLELYNVNPEVLIQEFTDKISFPVYYSNALSKDRWPTLFFLHYIETCIPHLEAERLFDTPYMDKLVDVIFAGTDKTDPLSSISAGREVQREWLKAKKEKFSSII